MKETMTAGVMTYSTFSHRPVMNPPHGPIAVRAEGIGRTRMRQRRRHLGDAEDEAEIHDGDDDAGDQQPPQPPVANPKFHPEKWPEMTAPTPSAHSDQIPA